MVEQLKELHKETKEKMVTLILAGFGLVAALAWNDAIQTLFNTLFPKKSSEIIGKFFYAILITVVVVIVSLQLRKISEKKEE